MCHIEKQINNFYIKFSECKDCNSKRELKRYFDNKGKTSNQRKIYYKKNKDKILQKQNDRYVHFEDLVRSYVGLENRLKAKEETLKTFSE